MASFCLLDLPSEIRTQIYRSFFEHKLIQVVPKTIYHTSSIHINDSANNSISSINSISSDSNSSGSGSTIRDTTTATSSFNSTSNILSPLPQDKYRPATHDTLHLLLTCRAIYNEAKPICINYAMFILDLHWSIAPFLTARLLNLRHITVERGFIHLLPPEGSFRDMIPPSSQWSGQHQQLHRHWPNVVHAAGGREGEADLETSRDESVSWADIDSWRHGLARFIVRFDLYLYVPGKGCCLVFDGCVPYNYIPRISNVWSQGLGSNMTVEFYGRNARGLPCIETYDPAIELGSDGKITVRSRHHNDVEEDCLVRRMLCYLNVSEAERDKCGRWDEDPIRRYGGSMD